MHQSLIYVFIWIVAANILAVIPSNDNHWKRAYWLIGIGVPLLIYVIWHNGIWIGLLVLIACASMLRWPVIYLSRWLRRLAARGPRYP